MTVQPTEPAGTLATDFVAALAAKDFGTLRTLLADDVRFRMLLPRGPSADEGAEATVQRVASWFGPADPIEVETAAATEVAGRMALTYRLRLVRDGTWKEIEQHLLLDLADDGRISAIDLLCSGFGVLAPEGPGDPSVSGTVHRYDAGDLGCADGLAVDFRRALTGIPVGHQLVVTTSDPAAKEDLPSLARLMGHHVRSIEATDDGRLHINVERRR